MEFQFGIGSFLDFGYPLILPYKDHRYKEQPNFHQYQQQSSHCCDMEQSLRRIPVRGPPLPLSRQRKQSYQQNQHDEDMAQGYSNAITSNEAFHFIPNSSLSQNTDSLFDGDSQKIKADGDPGSGIERITSDDPSVFSDSVWNEKEGDKGPNDSVDENTDANEYANWNAVLDERGHEGDSNSEIEKFSPLVSSAVESESDDISDGGSRSQLSPSNSVVSSITQTVPSILPSSTNPRQESGRQSFSRRFFPKLFRRSKRQVTGDDSSQSPSKAPFPTQQPSLWRRILSRSEKRNKTNIGQPENDPASAAIMSSAESLDLADSAAATQTTEHNQGACLPCISLCTRTTKKINDSEGSHQQTEDEASGDDEPRSEFDDSEHDGSEEGIEGDVDEDDNTSQDEDDDELLSPVSTPMNSDNKKVAILHNTYSSFLTTPAMTSLSSPSSSEGILTTTSNEAGTQSDSFQQSGAKRTADMSISRKETNSIDLDSHFDDDDEQLESYYMYGANDTNSNSNYCRADVLQQTPSPSANEGLYREHYRLAPTVACGSPHPFDKCDSDDGNCGDSLCSGDTDEEEESTHHASKEGILAIEMLDGDGRQLLPIRSMVSREELFLHREKMIVTEGVRTSSSSSQKREEEDRQRVPKTERPSGVSTLLFDQLPKLQLEMTGFDAPSSLVSPDLFDPSSAILPPSDRREWSPDLVPPDSASSSYRQRRNCCTRCRSDCTIWEFCQPVKCIIDQNEVEILPSPSRRDEGPIRRRPLNGSPRIEGPSFGPRSRSIKFSEGYSRSSSRSRESRSTPTDLGFSPFPHQQSSNRIRSFESHTSIEV